MSESIESRQGELIVFTSGKGGVGKTMLSVNTAMLMSSKEYDVSLIDGSFQFGDVNLALDIRPSLTISDLVVDIKSLDINLIPNYMLTHYSGLPILSAPIRPEYSDLITPGVMNTILGVIRDKYKFTIADLSTGLSEMNLSFIDAAKYVFLVTDLDMASLKNTKLYLKTLQLLGLKSKVTVIINKCTESSTISVSNAESILEADNYICVSSSKVVTKSFNEGVPFVTSYPNDKVTNDLDKIIYKLDPQNSINVSNKTSISKIKGLFGR